MSDQRSQQDMDNDFKPNGRPQSTMARNFSASLNSAFAIDDDCQTKTTPQLDSLAQSVSQKKAAVDFQTSELQALEARIKEMDKRLEQKQSRTSSPAGRAVGGSVTGGGGGGSVFSSGGVNAPGAAGNYYGAATAGTEDAAETQLTSASSPLADRTIKVPGGGENLSSSTRNRWIPGDERDAVAEGREV